MRDANRLLLPVKCQWNPGDALINLSTPNLPSPTAPLTEGKHTRLLVYRWTNWPALHKHATQQLNGGKDKAIRAMKM